MKSRTERENEYCREELEAFYACDKPNGDTEKERLRDAVLEKRDEFAKNEQFKGVKNTIKKGKYRHFKGTVYEVLFCANHSEDLSVMVVYATLDGETVWTRPLKEFIKPTPEGLERFTFID